MHMTFGVFDVKLDWHMENGESVHFLEASLLDSS